MSGTGTAKTLSKGKAKELNGLVEQLMQLGSKEYDTVAASLEQHRDMYGLLERIRRLEPKLRTTNGRQRAENLEHFTSWISSNKCLTRNVRIAEHFEYGGMGLETTGAIPPGESFIKVPRALFFYLRNEPQFKKLIELMPGSMLREQGNIMLALALIVERFRKDSFWKPYFDVLPERYATPLYYTPEDMAELNNTEAFVPALRLCKSIARQYGFIRTFVQERVDDLQNNFTYDVFRWAVSTVMTRQNKVPVNLAGFEGVDFTLALIPYWDMGNHAYPGAAGSNDNGGERKLVAETVYNSEQDRLECFLNPWPAEAAAADEAAPGSPVFIVYGKRTDAEFLVHNGFVVPHNKHTLVKRPFKLIPEDPLYKERSHLLKLIGMPTQGTFSFGHPDAGEIMSAELIAIARVGTMNEQELERYTAMEQEQQRKELANVDYVHPATLTNRANMWLAKSMRTLLQGYPTTIEQDEELLRSNRQMSHIRRLLVEYRLEEKRMLQSYITRAHDELRRLMSDVKLSSTKVTPT